MDPLLLGDHVLEGVYPHEDLSVTCCQLVGFASVDQAVERLQILHMGRFKGVLLDEELPLEQVDRVLELRLLNTVHWDTVGVEFGRCGHDVFEQLVDQHVHLGLEPGKLVGLPVLYLLLLRVDELLEILRILKSEVHIPPCKVCLVDREVVLMTLQLEGSVALLAV